MMRIRKILRKNKGFTLVETIVVIAIMAILASGVTFGVIQYQKHAEFKKNNEYAEMLFLATQSQLTYYKSSGELEDFAKEINGDKVSAEIAEYAKDKNGQLIHVDLKPGLTDADLKKTEVYKLTKDYISDRSIYNGAIRIELDPASGTVFSVSYSTKAESLVEGESTNETEVSVAVAMREDESLRREVMLGYYDTDIHFRKVKEKEDDGDIGDIDKQTSGLINDETLRIVLDFKNASPAVIGNGVYKVELYKGAGNGNGNGNKISEFVINDGSANNTLPSAYVSKQVKTKVTYGKVNNNNKPETAECIFETYITADGKLGIILDAMDISAVRKLNETTGTSAALDKATYKDTYSGMRLGIFGEELIQAKITVSTKSGSVAVEPFTTNKEAPFFKWDGKDNQGNRAEREIGYPRHLYNIRFTEERNEGKPYILKSDIVFGEKAEGIHSPAVFDNDAKNNLLKDEAYFPAIPVLKSGHKISGESTVNGKATQYKLKNFKVGLNENDEKQSKTLGIVSDNKGTIEKMFVENIELSDKLGLEVDGAGGLAAINNGTVEKSVVENITITGADNAKLEGVGGVVGINKGTVQKLEIDKTDLASSENIVLDSVGGIVGSNEGRIHNVYLKKATITAEKAVNVGGFVGKNTERGRFTADTRYVEKQDKYRNGSENITVTGDSQVGGLFGANYAETSHNEYNEYLSIDEVTIKGVSQVGGLIGRNEGNINKILVFKAKVEASGDHVGGVIGYNTATYGITDASDPTVYPLISALSDYSVTGENYVGGIIGSSTSTGVLQSTALIDSLVKGKNYVGGALGKNDGVYQFASHAPKSISNVNVTGVDYVGGIIGENTNSLKYVVTKGTSNKKSSVSGTNYVGGALGQNSGTYEFPSDKLGVTTYVEVAGKGSCVGGISGGNLATIKYVVARNVDVNGVNSVGGAIGENKGTYRFDNWSFGELENMTITGTRDRTGGIVGDNQGDSASIRNVNIKTSTLNGGRYTGGIAGRNSGVIDHNYWDQVSLLLSKVKGTESVGGLVGINTAKGVVSGSGEGAYCVENLTVEGTESVGGIAGQTEGNASIVGTKVDNTTLVSSGNAGGLIGTNSGTLSMAWNNQVAGVKLSAGTDAGALVGLNKGYITGNASQRTQDVNTSPEFVAGSAASNRGGIAGKNTGTINGVVFAGNISASKGINYGGITGYNTGGANNQHGIYNSYMNGSLTVNEVAKDKVLAIGGIAGNNAGKIENSGFLSASSGGRANILIGQESGKQLACHVGGIAGDLSPGGSIKNITYPADANVGVTLQIGYGSLGGIAGYSSGATIENCSTSERIALQVEDSTGASYLGGISGYVAVSGEIKYSNNESAIDGSQKENISTGGIVGYYDEKKKVGSQTFLIQNCANFGTITSGKYTGGIIGIVINQADDNAILDKCRNYVKVDGGAGMLYSINQSGKVGVSNSFTFLTSATPFIFQSPAGTFTSQNDFYFDSKLTDLRDDVNKTLGMRLVSANNNLVTDDEQEAILLGTGGFALNIETLTKAQMKALDQSVTSYFGTL